MSARRALLAFASLSASCGGEYQAVKKQRRVTADYELADGCPSTARWEDAKVRNGLEPEKPSLVYWLRSLFSPAEVAQLVRLLQGASFGTHGDSTDDEPAFEIYLNERQATERDDRLVSAARGLVDKKFSGCVTPFVREKFSCVACVPCAKLVRRYRPEERSRMLAHRDLVSSVTVVVELQRAGTPQKFGGGLFIKGGEEDPTSYVPMRPGDAFLHNYELLHGVQIACDDCSRYSLVVWFQEDAAKCRAGGAVEAAEQMFRRSAEAGVAEGRFSYATRVIPLEFDDGGRMEHRVRAQASAAGEGGDASEYVRRVGGEAIAFLEAAAVEQGHARSALFLAQLHLLGVPLLLRPDLTEVERWRRHALALASAAGAEQLVAGWDEQFGSLLLEEARANASRRSSSTHNSSGRAPRGEASRRSNGAALAAAATATSVCVAVAMVVVFGGRCGRGGKPSGAAAARAVAGARKGKGGGPRK